MLIGNFDPLYFLRMLFILVTIPTALAYLLIYKLIPGEEKSPKNLASGLLLAFFVGFMSAAAWLSWSPGSSIANFFLHGPPNMFPQWQVICFGTSLVLGSALITYFMHRTAKGALGVALFTGSGFSAAFAVGASFGVHTQEGVGVAFSLIGGLLLCIPLNLAVVGLKRIDKRKSSAK